MRKIFVVTIVSLILCPKLFGQMPLYDALRLTKEYQDGQVTKSPEVLGILASYVRAGASANEIETAFRTNPFFQVEGGTQSFIQPGVAGIASMLGGADVTTIAEGFTSFLISRARQELSVAFFDKMREAIAGQEELKALFPLTSNVLLVVDPLYYASFLQSLRESFREDLKSLFTNLSAMLGQPKYRSWFKSDTLQALIVKTLPAADRLGSGENPVIVMRDVGKSLMANGYTQKVGFGMSTVVLYVSSLRAPESSGRMWLSATEVRKALADTIRLRIYLGLLYQQAEGIEFTDGADTIRLRGILQNFLHRYEQIRPIIAAVAERADVVEATLDKLHAAPRDTREELYLQYIISLNSLFDLSLKSVPHLIPKIDIQEMLEDFRTYASYVNRLNLVYVDTKAGRYSSAVIGSAGLLQSVLKKDSLDAFIHGFVKYGTFAATLAEAKDPDQVEAAVESAVLPAGSAAIKRQARFDLSLNSFLGLFDGREYLSSTGFPERASEVRGFYAPVGIAVSFPLSQSLQKWFTLSAFVQMLDLGALTAYRLQSDSISVTPQIKLENIFAPGFYGILHFRGVPISLGGGYQRGPTLRNISTAGVDIANNSVYRWSGFVAVDIPLFNFYTNPW
jgi:hypothetical protein